MVRPGNIQDVAKYVLLYSFINGLTITPLKLQKLLYYLQSWYLVYFDHALLFEDKPQAWVNGPVYPTIYKAYKHIGIYDQMTPQNTGITCPECSFTDELRSTSERLTFNEDDLNYMSFILQYYGCMGHDKLVFLTHSELPWSEKREGLEPFESSSEELDLETMFSYYNTRLQNNRARAK